MLKRLHKIAFIICTICFLGLSSWAHTDVNTAALKNITAEQMNFVSQDVKVDDLDIEIIRQQFKITVINSEILKICFSSVQFSRSVEICLKR